MESFIYGVLSFRVYDFDCPCLDTEWLLSTLFDASLLSTFKAAGLRRLFFLPKAIWGGADTGSRHEDAPDESLRPVAFRRMTRGNHIRACRWTPRLARAMICSS